MIMCTDLSFGEIKDFIVGQDGHGDLLWFRHWQMSICVQVRDDPIKTCSSLAGVTSISRGT
jgi:hypothetical protein